MGTHERSQPSQEEAFRLVMSHRTMLMAYIRAIVHDPELAEDALEDASVEIVRCWDRYDPSRPFPNWARGVARRVALACLRSYRKQPLLLDETVLEDISVAVDSLGSQVHLESRKEALQKCVDGLSEANRRLVHLRYFENRSYDEIAAALARSVDSLYVAFCRIHRALHDCVEKRLIAE
jgi:RNA polymerase sigma-70 factor (ECF subfamily)